MMCAWLRNHRAYIYQGIPNTTSVTQETYCGYGHLIKQDRFAFLEELKGEDYDKNDGEEEEEGKREVAY